MIEIEEGLNVPKQEIEIVNTYVECIFVDEDGNKHNRFMKVTVTDKVTVAKTNEVLKQFYV